MALALDRLKGGIFSIVKTATARLAYAAPRFATVVSAAPDGSTLDLVPEDPNFPPMGGVPLFSGQAGDRAVLAVPGEGTRVLVEFSEADPSRPFVRSWAAAGAERVARRTIDADAVVINAGTAGAARVGDSVRLVLSPADIASIAAAMVAAGLVSPGSGGAAPAPVPVTGTNVIASGSATVRIG